MSDRDRHMGDDTNPEVNLEAVLERALDPGEVAEIMRLDQALAEVDLGRTPVDHHAIALFFRVGLSCSMNTIANFTAALTLRRCVAAIDGRICFIEGVNRAVGILADHYATVIGHRRILTESLRRHRSKQNHSREQRYRDKNIFGFTHKETDLSG